MTILNTNELNSQIATRIETKQYYSNKLNKTLHILALKLTIKPGFYIPLPELTARVNGPS